MRIASFVHRFRSAPLVAAAATSLGAQGATEHMHHASAPAQVARAEVYRDAALRATRAITTPELARAAGYVPVFGNAPLQGEHFARPDLIMRDSFDMNQPSIVMFARVGGRPTLVGVAYTFYLPTDRMQPRGWDGAADVWHSHEDIGKIPGKHIVMMHTWFVGNPEGTFGHDNPWLPYYAAALTPPVPDAHADSASAALLRRTGLILGFVTEPPAIVDRIQRQTGPALAERTASTRDQIVAMLPRLRSAQAAGDTVAFSALRGELAARGDTLVALYREASNASPKLAGELDTVIGMYLGRGIAHRAR